MQSNSFCITSAIFSTHDHGLFSACSDDMHINASRRMEDYLFEHDVFINYLVNPGINISFYSYIFFIYISIVYIYIYIVFRSFNRISLSYQSTSLSIYFILNYYNIALSLYLTSNKSLLYINIIYIHITFIYHSPPYCDFTIRTHCGLL